MANTGNSELQLLNKRLQALERCLVAFSGGLDSTFLLAAAVEALGENAVAVTAVSDYMPKDEIEEAKRLAEGMGAKHRLIVIPFPELIRHNPRNRCYLCKREIFSRILEEGRRLGIHNVIEGTNADDLQEDRPGLQALRELHILSPLLEAGFTKKDIRYHSRRMDLPTWDKPAYACLMTRLPFDEPVTREGLDRVQKAERCLKARGIRSVRVRSHGQIARIEVSREERSRFFDEGLMDEISRGLRSLGFLYVTLDLEGYKTGSMGMGSTRQEGERK
jgi:uncharacterized protein